MDKEFPTPFGGCTQSLAINPTRFERLMTYLARGCNGQRHKHNFAVEVDSPGVWPVVYGSELLMECIQKGTRS